MEEEQDWTISDGMIKYIATNIPQGTILELGSGEGSQKLIHLGYRIWAVEHDKEWVDKFNNVKYFYAPIKKHKAVRGFAHEEWYDKDVIWTIPKYYNAIIVDGPPGCIGRSGFLKYLDLFNTNVPIIFDDLHRKLEMKLAQKVAHRLGRPLSVISWESKTWGVVHEDSRFNCVFG